MKVRKNISGPKDERGVVILLVAVFLLFVVGAMAALAIDLVTFYTARSEAQLAADGAALAAARVIANSGMTSNPGDFSLVANVEFLARTVATQVAVHNKVGGRFLVDNGTEIIININPAPTPPAPKGSANPQVTVRISRNDLPTFFARIWGTTQVAVSATATAEAYNPSGMNLAGGEAPPVAPVCVKPWVLPNIDPITSNPIFDPATGDIQDTTLLGKDLTARKLFHRPIGSAPSRWRYYAGDISSFPVPTQSLPTCGVPLTTNYQKSVAGCVQVPLSCSSLVALDPSPSGTIDADTADPVNCLTHAESNNGDRLDIAGGPTPPFEFIAGDDNPLALPSDTKVLVSDSVVTVPVYASTGAAPTSPVQVIGFVQLFLNPDGNKTPTSGFTAGRMVTTVVNLVGCGTNATGQPIQGNGNSAVAVRLVTP